MKKLILFLALSIITLAAFSQTEPAHVKQPKTMQPGNWYMVGQWDSINSTYKDTLGFYLENDTVQFWSNKPMSFTSPVIMKSVQYTMPHGYFSTIDTSGYVDSLTQNVWKTIAKPTALDSVYINYTTNDTIQYTGTLPGHLQWNIHIVGSNSNVSDIWIRLINITDNRLISYDMNTSANIGDFTSLNIAATDVNCEVGDKYLIQLLNRSNGDDFTRYVTNISAVILHFN